MGKSPPITLLSFERFLDRQAYQFSEIQQDYFKQIRVPVRREKIRREDRLENVFVAAEIEGELVFYDDVEGGFKMAKPNDDGVIDVDGVEHFTLRDLVAGLIAKRDATSPWLTDERIRKQELRNAVFYLALHFVVIGLFVVGLVGSLFGPAWARWAGMVAFVTTMFLVAVVDDARKRGRLHGLEDYFPLVRRLRWLVWSALLVSVVISLVCIAVGMTYSGGAGVTDGTRPVFDDQPVYKLGSHGRDTIVTRHRYLIVGSSFTIGWHAMGILIALFGLHVVLFGRTPPGYNDEDATSKKKYPRVR